MTDPLVQAAIEKFTRIGCGDGAHRLPADGESFPKRCWLYQRWIDEDGRQADAAYVLAIEATRKLK